MTPFSVENESDGKPCRKTEAHHKTKQFSLLLSRLQLDFELGDFGDEYNENKWLHNFSHETIRLRPIYAFSVSRPSTRRIPIDQHSEQYQRKKRHASAEITVVSNQIQERKYSL